jgi:hypothetical protein
LEEDYTSLIKHNKTLKEALKNDIKALKEDKESFHPKYQPLKIFEEHFLKARLTELQTHSVIGPEEEDRLLQNEIIHGASVIMDSVALDRYGEMAAYLDFSNFYGTTYWDYIDMY